MYAVIRSGGKQYRVAPGDVVRLERLTPADGGQVQFEVMAVFGNEGQIGSAQNASVTGQVVGEGRGDKVLVFHYKRKKQYKKLRGHRQAFTAVRITELALDGQRFQAPEATAAKQPKAPEGDAAPEEAVQARAPKRKASGKGSSKAEAAGPGSKTAGRSGSSSKATGSKGKGGSLPKPKK